MKHVVKISVDFLGITESYGKLQGIKGFEKSDVKKLTVKRFFFLITILPFSKKVSEHVGGKP